MMISLLAAYTKTNRIIGAQGKIPWNLSTERNRFKQICSGKFVIMGRKTFEEIGKALSYCTIIVVSKTLNSVPEGCQLFSNLNDAIKFCQNQNQEILIAGGEEIYRQTITQASRIYATEIDAKFSGDRYFPEIEEHLWNKKICQTLEENGIKFEYITYEKI